MNVIEEIAAERQRQIEVEGFLPDMDDFYEKGELALAAAAYVEGPWVRKLGHRLWPFLDHWWKPTNRRRDLIKAGALIVAEIERLDRLAARL